MNIFGKWRNSRGIELEVTGLCVQDVIGTIYRGVIADELFGQSDVLVTTQGLEESGYQKADSE